MNEGVKSSLRARLGAFIATISVLTAAGVVLFHEIDFLRPYLTHSMIALGFAGLGAVIQGQMRRQQLSEEEVLQFYHDPAYWGRCMIVSAGLTYLVAAFFFAEEQPITKVLAQTGKPPVQLEEPASAPPEEITEEAAPEFPELTLRGVVLNGEKSTALIDGYTVQKGEFVKGVRLVEVSEAGVVVEMDGQFRTILRQGLKHRD